MWLRMVAKRATWSTSASTLGPGRQAVRRAAELDRLVVADPVDVGDPGAAALPADLARVGDLAAALGVEGALLELDERAPVVTLDGEQAGLGAQLLVADEARRRRRRGEAEHRAVVVLGAVRGRGPHPGARPLLLHQLLEALVVDREALLGEQLLGQVVREAVGVVELEGVLRVDPGGLGPRARGGSGPRPSACRDRGCDRSSPPRRAPSAGRSRARRASSGRLGPSSSSARSAKRSMKGASRPSERPCWIARRMIRRST